MTLRRVETNEGIHDQEVARGYDRMTRRISKRGLLGTDKIIDSGIVYGLALEVGSGPGYIGLKWLSEIPGTKLTGLDISPVMVEMAKGNAEEYGLSDRAEYVVGDAQEMPFEDDVFDAVFSMHSLHEWSHPKKIFNEIHRVLKPGGLYYIGDLRRDMNPLVRTILKLVVGGKAMREGLVASTNASYTKDELTNMLHKTKLAGAKVNSGPIRIEIVGRKARV